MSYDRLNALISEHERIRQERDMASGDCICVFTVLLNQVIGAAPDQAVRNEVALDVARAIIAGDADPIVDKYMPGQPGSEQQITREAQ